MSDAAQLVLYLVIYILVAFVIYAIANQADPYIPENDSYCDGDSNKGLAFMWPLWVPIVFIASPFILLYFGFEHIRKMGEKERKSRPTEIWDNLVETSSDKTLSSLLNDLTLQTFPEDSKLTIHVGRGQHEILKAECSIYDLPFARDIAEKNNLLDRPILDLKTSYLKENGIEITTIDVYL